MKVILLLIILNHSISYCQKTIEDVLFPSDSCAYLKDFYQLNFDAVKVLFDSLQISNEDKEAFYECYFKDGAPKSQTDFYKFNFSRDGLDDIIYYGHLCGIEEKLIIIWINTGEGYYESARLLGTILKVILNHNEPTAFITEDEFCCDSYVGNINLIVPNDQYGKIKFEKSETVKEFIDLQLPTNKILPIRFEVINDESKLRLSPFIMDSIDYYESGILEGNILGKLKIGSNGLAIGNDFDKFNNEWWFVIIDGDAQFSYNKFYNDQNKKKLGWIRKSDLKVDK